MSKSSNDFRSRRCNAFACVSGSGLMLTISWSELSFAVVRSEIGEVSRNGVSRTEVISRTESNQRNKMSVRSCRVKSCQEMCGVDFSKSNPNINTPTISCFGLTIVQGKN